MPLHFVAYPAADKIHAETINAATTAATTAEVTYKPWPVQDGSGSPLGASVESWIEDAEAVVADITFVNDNVTYEIGFAIAAGKHLRLIRNESVPITDLKNIGLLDMLLRDPFKTRADLTTVLQNRAAPPTTWHQPERDRTQPVYVLTPPAPTPFTTALLSSVKKRGRHKFRSFNIREIARFTALDAWQQGASSFGLVATWQDASDLDARRNNQRAAFLTGIARGLDIPVLLIAHPRSELPADLSDIATRIASESELPALLSSFRDDVQDAINDYAEAPTLPLTLLDRIYCGHAAAEDEQDSLAEYFLETEEFKSTLDGNAHLIIGRKGSGKSAICLQVRDRTRAKKNNIVIDLNPEGYQLIKLKELIGELTTRGFRKEFIAAFWQYVLWLEIAYKILEKDAKPAQRDGQLLARYQRLKAAFEARVDTGTNDFSERLRLLTDQIAERFDGHRPRIGELVSSDVLQIVYGTDVAAIRNEILSYLKIKGIILFLFDNLDRMRSPGGFDDADAIIILGLIESLQDISKRFRRSGYDFRWAVFIRSDVYEFVVRAMADYGKQAQLSLEWQDRDLLIRLLQQRITTSLQMPVDQFDKIWPTLSVPTLLGEPTLAYLVEAAVMRPRYLIRLFESAKRRAINLSHQRILEEDYTAALEDLGWTIFEDLNLELRDIVANADNLLYDLGQLNGACGLPELRSAISARVGATDVVKRVTDVLLWSGALGLAVGNTTTHIYDCGYKLGYLHSLIDTNPHLEIRLHPTLASLLAPVDTTTRPGSSGATICHNKRFAS